MAEQQTTLREIAKKAGVSSAAVSNALHGKGRMTPQTREMLEQMLKQAGYKPSYKLRPALYLSSHRILVDMHNLHPLLSKYEGLNAAFAAAEMPMRMELLDLPGSPSLTAQLEQYMASRPSGVILDTVLDEQLPEVVAFFQKRNVQVLQIGYAPLVAGVASVVVESFGGAYAGAKHLIEQGHTRIATIRWNVAGDPASNQKFAGFRCAMDEAGLAIPDKYVVETRIGRSTEGQPGRIAVNALLSLPQPPTAVFVENSFVSPSLIYPIPPERHVPEAIAGLDMVHFEAWSLDWLEQVAFSKLSLPRRDVKLLRIDWYELGQVAAGRMLAMLEGDRRPGQVTCVSPCLTHVAGEHEESVII